MRNCPPTQPIGKVGFAHRRFRNSIAVQFVTMIGDSTPLPSVGSGDR